jgi:methylenetetrahydrofolate dehydrogenase (NADP+)/methenyltetrahydrofolate cyclohydrolase
MTLIEGKKVSEEILGELQVKISQMMKKPKLAIIYLGQSDASDIYIRNKIKACEKVGIESSLYHLENPTTNEVKKLINQLNNDETISGIIMQSPIPKNLDYNLLCNLIDSQKDVDGFTMENVYCNYQNEPGFLPCTVKGIIYLLKYYHVDLTGKHVVIIGRSNIVGKPLINAFLNENATVTSCNSYTISLKSITSTADIVISAVGKPNLITDEFIKPNSVVIDVGINRLNGKLCGDVDFASIKNKCSYITPVPGGVGPMTIAMLLSNTYDAERRQNNG